MNKFSYKKKVTLSSSMLARIRERPVKLSVSLQIRNVQSLKVLNIVSKNQKPNAKYPQGGIIKMEAPIHISNLNVVDPASGKPTRIGRKKNEEGKTIRYAKKSGEEIK